MINMYTIDSEFWEITDSVVAEYMKSDEYKIPEVKKSIHARDRAITVRKLNEKLGNVAPTDLNLPECIVITNNERDGLIGIIDYLKNDDFSELLKYLQELKPNKKI